MRGIKCATRFLPVWTIHGTSVISIGVVMDAIKLLLLQRRLLLFHDVSKLVAAVNAGNVVLVSVSG
jgi:hypothetical protein